MFSKCVYRWIFYGRPINRGVRGGMTEHTALGPVERNTPTRKSTRSGSRFLCGFLPSAPTCVRILGCLRGGGSIWLAVTSLAFRILPESIYALLINVARARSFTRLALFRWLNFSAERLSQPIELAYAMYDGTPHCWKGFMSDVPNSKMLCKPSRTENAQACLSKRNSCTIKGGGNWLPVSSIIYVFITLFSHFCERLLMRKNYCKWQFVMS